MRPARIVVVCAIAALALAAVAHAVERKLRVSAADLGPNARIPAMPTQEWSFAELGAQATMAVSAEAMHEALLSQPGIRAALDSKTPDAVDRLIQGILEGRGNGGVVTSEFNQGGVHATIISNVNHLKITQVQNEKEANEKASAEQGRKQKLKELADKTIEENEKHAQVRSARRAISLSRAPRSDPRPLAEEVSAARPHAPPRRSGRACASLLLRAAHTPACTIP
jgi:hypothetical protein